MRHNCYKRLYLPFSKCYNTVGSYFCGCNVGYEYIGSYDDLCTTEVDEETGQVLVDDEGNCLPGVRHLPIEDPDCVNDRNTMDAATFDATWPENCGPVCANVYECITQKYGTYTRKKFSDIPAQFFMLKMLCY